MLDQDFASYLYRGLGRTYRILQEQASAPYHEALLEACLYNPVYDPQAEGAHTDYLYGLVQLSDDPKLFERQILEAFADPDEEMHIEQLFGFALIYAKAGNQRARQLIYEQALDLLSIENVFGLNCIVELDGIEGFRFAASRLSEAAALDSDFYVDSSLIDTLKQALPELKDMDLEALTEENPAIRSYLALAHQNQLERQERAAQPKIELAPTYAGLQEYIATNQRTPKLNLIDKWCLAANQDDFEAVAHDLLLQDTPKKQADYLAFFGKRQFPLAKERLFPFIYSENRRVSWRALKALSLFDNPSLRELAFELIRSNWRVDAVSMLFRLNFQAGDEWIFAELLSPDQDHEVIHGISRDIINILRDYSVPNEKELLYLLYERQPCSLCRKDLIERLAELMAIPDWMLQECWYDCNEEIRAIAANYSA
jgi:hypothetical protein